MLIFTEWIRKPLSKLEKTLRVPLEIKYGLVIFITRFLPWLAALSFVSWLLTKSVTLGIVLTFPVFLVVELITLRTWYDQILPVHLKNVAEVKEIYQASQNFSENELIKALESAVDKSTWGIINLGYVGLVAAWGWEIIFRSLYPILFRSKLPYTNLLLGFPNKSSEADQKLWEIAHIKDKNTHESALKKYLDGYGSRAEDWDLQYPTLRESSQTITALLELDRTVPAPHLALKLAIEKRKSAQIEAIKSTFLPKAVAQWLIMKVQMSVQLREDRRFHEFEMDYIIRQMLFHLAKLHHIDETKLFTMTWQEIKK